MRFRVRTWDGPQPLPNLDVTTGSVSTMLRLVEDRVDSWGWDNVSVIETGARPLKGEQLRVWAERHRTVA